MGESSATSVSHAAISSRSGEIAISYTFRILPFQRRNLAYVTPHLHDHLELN